MSSILLRGGLVIDTDPIAVQTADLLITDGRIAAVGPDLTAETAEVLDVSGHYVLPGFVDTHRHMWQTGLRALTADADLGAYLQRVLYGIGPRVTPQDLHDATLAGALEALDAGVTTVQDYAQTMHTPEHTDAALSAYAGLRAVLAHGGLGATDEAELRRVHGLARGTTSLMLASHGPSYGDLDEVARDHRLARELGLRLAAHVGHGGPLTRLKERGLLGPEWLYVHGNPLDDEELRLMADSGGTASVAPAVEARMGHGAPVLARLRAAGVPTGLGVDVVTTAPGDMFSLMRAAMTSAGGTTLSTSDALRAATIDGARALGMDGLIGSLAVGKRADVITVRAHDANLIGATDPVAAVVASAHAGNVDTVLVDGVVRKRAGTLPGADLSSLAASLRESLARLSR
ncbi:TRZ/ATZ family hydrolase [Actinorhabdospora filicis]|uniref:TRZ/ATZ family hydrolase n=1 Tax=Actinorhabdospora filicis TaxID=1785913 RepID=A0A9W6W5C0_9ACTN|nr:amidohydrolase family protein [Actinorhabdospora filicis]GLZ80212.1 TRZ/ATZ family hydrolase [Actinorhabdospora filicis]